MNQPSPDISLLDTILSTYPADEASLIQVLQDVQQTYNYLPQEALYRISKALSVPLAKVFSVATFYKSFSLEPQGRCLVHVCTGTACHIRGAGQLMEEMERHLDLGPEGTTEDLEFTVKTVNCVGACALAPVVIVDGKYHGKARPAKMTRALGLGKGEAGHAN